MRVHQQKKRLTGSGRYRLPAAVAAAVLCTYLLTAHYEYEYEEEKISYSPSNYLRSSAAVAKKTSPFGFVIPEGRAVALPSVRIDAKESSRIDRKIYGGEGGE